MCTFKNDIEYSKMELLHIPKEWDYYKTDILN